MAKKQPEPKPLQTIDLTSLHDVTGGRVSRSSQPDPQVMQGIKSLAEVIQQVGAAMTQSKAQKSQEMMGMMQQMMQQRRG